MTDKAPTYYLYLACEGPHPDNAAIGLHIGWWCGEAGIVRAGFSQARPVTMQDVFEIIGDLKASNLRIQEMLVSIVPAAKGTLLEYLKS